MKILSFFLDVIDDGVMLWGFLLFGVYFSEGLRNLLESLCDVDAVFGTDLEKLHAFRFTKLLNFLFWYFSIFLFAVDFIAQNANLDIRGCIFFDLVY